MRRSPRHRVSLDELEALYRERLDAFCSVAASITGDRDAARDVVHTAFASAVQKRLTFKRKSRLETWIWSLVVNAARDHRRRVRPTHPLADESVDRASQNGNAEALTGEIERGILVLPERQRLALFLRYYADLDYQTIAETLGVAPGTVGALLHAAHETLRRELAEVNHE